MSAPPCIPLDVVNGLVRCVHPGIDGHVSFGTVLNVDYDAGLMQSYMDVEDLEGRVLNAIKEYGCDLTVLGNYGNSAPGIEPVTSGHWDDIAYDSLTDTTTFTDFSATFPPQAVNWWLQPDAARSTYLEILSISASTVTVAGDAEGLAHGLIPQPGPPPLPDIIGSFYTIVWPAGVDPASGTLAHNDPCEPVSRLLFAGYYYMPPMAGTMVQPPGGGTGIHGQQPGGNHHGDYYCWNRVYAQKNGVWTTPDPAKMPWYRLLNYCRSSPLGYGDRSGLSIQTTPGGVTYEAWGYCELLGRIPAITEAVDILYKALEEAESSLKSLRSSLKGGFRTNSFTGVWFGGNDGLNVNELDRVLGVVSSVLRAAKNKDWNFYCDCGCRGDASAYILRNKLMIVESTGWMPKVLLYHSNTVHICPVAFERSAEELAAILFHELTHAWAQTEDYGYYAGWHLSNKNGLYRDVAHGRAGYRDRNDPNQKVALSTSQKLNNADSYSSWLYHIFILKDYAK